VSEVRGGTTSGFLHLLQPIRAPSPPLSTHPCQKRGAAQAPTKGKARFYITPAKSRQAKIFALPFDYPTSPGGNFFLHLGRGEALFQTPFFELSEAYMEILPRALRFLLR